MQIGLPKTRSAWIDGVEAPQFESLKQDLAANVAVIGGGITGLMTALRLREEGLSVVLLEAAQWGAHGTTHRTSGHLTAVQDVATADLISRFGEDGARAAVSAGMIAISEIERVSAGLDCEFQRVDGFRYTEHEDRRDALREDAENACRLGLDAAWLDSAPLPFATAGAYRVGRQAIFQPVKFMNNLARRLLAKGVKIFANTRVTNVEPGSPCKVKTEHGLVTAPHVVLATHSPLGLWVSIQARLVPYRSYCALVRTNAPVPHGLYWDDENPYNYTRPFSTAPGANQLVIGGRDHKTGEKLDTTTRFEELSEWIAARFPGAEIDTMWSNELFEPADGLPYIGAAPGADGVYVATGFSGTGLTFGTASAILISDLIAGRSNPWAELFSPSRLKPIASAGRIVEEAGAMIRGLVLDRLLREHPGALEQLGNNEGKTLKMDGKYWAVHRDGAGKIHAVSALCPHMGCIVHWNSAEKTWDCPCHGSIFESNGQVAAGPAAGGLNPAP